MIVGRGRRNFVGKEKRQSNIVSFLNEELVYKTHTEVSFFLSCSHVIDCLYPGLSLK